MGVPKFFRYISERYPCLSEVVREYQIPEFDNLYLDMNGIIHMCSHPDDENVHFRITEEQIFKDIFHYIEVLFRMIRPQKLFFMAVDGVAPRAKMNQQRGRRFRSAKEAEKRENDAEKKGEVLPEAARFDSNCITPGTVFMARLHEQLQYFVVDKISNDSLWQNCKVILSGHETPGEGEHKIMDYIRYMRAQPGYDPNTRHCLYGLDADLIMLGLCTHEPHFSLLREEVKFGKKSAKRVSVPEEITFYLLHLSLMREYLELEFSCLKESLTTFDFDIDKIIDDWVLMGFLVGNDFIPNLPNLHIINGALPFLYKAYMEVLPTLDGYINENGDLNLSRFEKFMQKLSGFDFANFEEIRDDLLYMEAKTGRKQIAHTKVTCNPSADDSVEINSEEKSTPEIPRDAGLAALIQEADDFAQLSLEEQEEWEEDTDASEDEAFTNYKREYYQNKMEFAKVTPEVMRAQAEGYVRAIQWNLNYYYKGCRSWSWYYPHHYSPYISDIKGFSNLNLEFDIGKPFLPFEQLLAVLPPASKDLLPHCYHDLMTKDSSLIKQYYPESFQTDLNGKKQEWEAVVLVPFIDENLLLEAMSYCNDHLTEEEAARNRHGPMLIYTYTDRDKGPYYAPEYFSPITSNHTDLKTLSYDDVMIPKDKLITGVHPKAQMNVYYPGFPTLKHLKYKAELRNAKIKVFDYASRGENMIISVIPNDKISSGEMIPVDLLGNLVFVKWPHLTEAKVVAISNLKRKYVNMGQGQYNVVDQTPATFKSEVEGISEFYERRMGILVGETKVLIYVQTLMGKKYVINPDGKLTLEKQFTPNITCYPLQVLVYNIKAFDGYKTDGKEIEHIFPRNSICFTLTNPYYGSKGVVQENLFKKTGRMKITVSVQEEPDFRSVENCRQKIGRSYKTLYSAASQLALSNNMFSRITGSIFVKVPGNEGTLRNFNIGLDLKMNKKNLEMPGYTRKIGPTWHYSDKATELVRSYCERFPEVFDYLRSDCNFDAVNPEDLFGEDWEDRLAELKEWLRSLPSNEMDRQICGSLALEPEVVEEIEKTVDGFKSSKIKNVTMQIKPTFLYRPEIQSGTLVPDPKMDVRILDRIVNVRCGYTVPFGLKGTITAIQESLTGSDRDTLYDVVFDSPFKDGMKLNCSARRGYRLPKYSFINISYGKRLMEQKIGKTDDVIAASQTNIPNNPFSNNVNPNNTYQPFNTNPKQKFGQSNSAFAQVSSVSHTRPTYELSELGLNHHARPFIPQNQYQKRIELPTVFNPFSKESIDSFKSKSNEVTPSKNMPIVNKEAPSVKNRPEKNRKEGNVSENWRSTININKDSPKKPLVNIDFLKNLLIENSNQEPSVTAPLSTQSRSDKSNEDVLPKETSSSSTPNKQNYRKETVVSFEQFTQLVNVPASIRLLTYYQSNGLGLPRYQYLNCEDGLQAQITLSDGKLIVGKPAETREEASENVASNVLDLFLKNKTKTDGYLKEDFPTPPQTWVQSEQNVTGQTSSDSSNKLQQTTKTETSALLNNPFVPLQAVKNHINKANKQNNESIKENIQHTQETSDRRTNGDKDENSMNAPQRERRKERKTRIAANFNKK